MKPIIILIFTLFVTSKSYSNEIRNLTPLDFENDTVDYITYIFEENKQNYVNKRLSHLIDDYDINIGYVKPNVDSNNLLYGINIFYNDLNEVIAKKMIGFTFIDIDFTDPYIDFESIKDLWEKSTEKEKLELLREYVIKDITVGMNILFH